MVGMIHSMECVGAIEKWHVSCSTGRVFRAWIVVDSVAIQRVVILASRWLGVVVALT